MYPSELQLNKTNSSETEVLFLDLHLSISDEFISCKIYDKRNGFDFDYHKLRKAFFKKKKKKYLDVISILVSKVTVGIKLLLQQGLTESEFHGDLVYKFRKIYACNYFSPQFRKVIIRYIKIWYSKCNTTDCINVIRQTACMVVNPITVNNLASLFGCKPSGRA